TAAFAPRSAAPAPLPSVPSFVLIFAIGALILSSALNTASIENFLPAMVGSFPPCFWRCSSGRAARVFVQLGPQALIEKHDLTDRERARVGEPGIVAGALQ